MIQRRRDPSKDRQGHAWAKFKLGLKVVGGGVFLVFRLTLISTFAENLLLQLVRSSNTVTLRSRLLKKWNTCRPQFYFFRYLQSLMVHIITPGYCHLTILAVKRILVELTQDVLLAKADQFVLV